MAEWLPLIVFGSIFLAFIGLLFFHEHRARQQANKEREARIRAAEEELRRKRERVDRQLGEYRKSVREAMLDSTSTRMTRRSSYVPRSRRSHDSSSSSDFATGAFVGSSFGDYSSSCSSSSDSSSSFGGSSSYDSGSSYSSGGDSGGGFSGGGCD